ncbi:hypothetical protein Rhopal_007676-T1 [Rhodotorula paludigena]|uniref:DJ-1/PfpI domain-containing protein n=1 Tax=Rhodotorula paludigena TaxID=86838 RepID=A0AAV5GWJ3_9BASI|nr:hypothetical protein Rhopal_007676-T1 [Rhodotorula paludigena]
MTRSQPGQPRHSPYHVAVALFPGFELLDVTGPLEVLNMLSRETPIKLSLLSTTLDPVSTKTADMPYSMCEQSMVPTHTYEVPPSDIDALLVPGGTGARLSPDPHFKDLHAFLRQAFPSLDYLLTVCTGSALVAQTGLLDDRCATSNKNAWEWVQTQGERVEWVKDARWVEDDNVWTSAGVSAGIDMTLAWVAKLWGLDRAHAVAKRMEYVWKNDSSADTFA